MLTEAVTKAIVTIKDLHHSISFPSWFREPVLFTSCFLKLAGCNTALLHKVGALTSAMWLTSGQRVTGLVTAVTLTWGVDLTSLLLFQQHRHGKGTEAEVA